MDKLEYLEIERQKMWQRISSLEEEVKKKTSDYEAEAKQSSKKTSEFRNKSEVSFGQIKDYEDIAKRNSEGIVALFKKVKSVETSLQEKIDYINQQYSSISTNEETYSSDIESLESMFENFDDFEEKVSSLKTLSTDGEETFNKINQLLKVASERRNEINKLYLEIVGYKEQDENDEEIFVPGLKNNLEESYDEIEEKVNTLQKQLGNIIVNSKANLENKISEFETIFLNVNSKIEGLLPQALTAGLSYAYSAKREAEEKEETKQTKYFSLAIFGMIIVSTIPFGVSTYQLVNNVELYEVLIQIPRMVLAILPLYIPVVWFAYSSSKKRNLSKRLIEEYTHKEVLSKTFEGLSTQIKNVKDSNISSDLTNRLLYNVLEVTSDNPGKLISDYNKSDHPFMEALDKSVQLANSIEKLSKIPGLGKLTSFLEKRAKKLMEDKIIEVEKGLDSALTDDDE